VLVLAGGWVGIVNWVRIEFIVERRKLVSKKEEYLRILIIFAIFRIISHIFELNFWISFVLLSMLGFLSLSLLISSSIP
jgi:hypothetical protein